MSKEILLSLNQNDILTGFKFKTTGITVFSFEEALYHFYYYWKESQNDFLCDDFVSWVSDVLGLDYLVLKILEIRKIENFTEKYISILMLIDYFSLNEIKKLKKELEVWESRLAWERYKEQGDYFASKMQYEKALLFYNKAKEYDLNADLFNNIACVYIKIGKTKKGCEFLEKAYSLNKEKAIILFNYCEALILNNELAKAEKLILEVNNKEDSYYLKGILCLQKNDYIHAVSNFNKAYSLNNDDFYIYKIIDLYLNVKIFDIALQYLDKIINKDEKYLLKISDVLSQSGNIDGAIKYIEKGIKVFDTNSDIWTNYAKLLRLKNNLSDAENAVSKALSINKKNENAMLEKAIIKKEQGLVKEYQEILSKIIYTFKNRYREINEIF